MDAPGVSERAAADDTRSKGTDVGPRLAEARRLSIQRERALQTKLSTQLSGLANIFRRPSQLKLAKGELAPSEMSQRPQPATTQPSLASVASEGVPEGSLSLKGSI